MPSPRKKTWDMERVIPLIGRESELTQLQRVFERTLQGERQVVFVTGEAGIGKTTLVDAFLAQLRERADVRITSGQCIEHYGPGEAYLPLLEATQQLCRAPNGEQRIAALQRYAPSWLAQLPGLLEPQVFVQLQQRVRGTSRERMLREMAEAAEGFTTRRGLVLVLEDLHWSDVSTLEWLSYMAQRREPAKLLIVGTYRPTETLLASHPLRMVVHELLARRQCEELRVTPFSEATIRDYLRRRFARAVTDRSPLQELAPMLYHRTGGNPLFVVNVVDDLLQQGIVREEGGLWQVDGDQLKVTESVPNTLRQVIERQMERLPVAAQHLLEVASIVGIEFSAAAVAAGLQAPVEEVDQQCELLARHGQFIREQGSEEWPDSTLSERYGFQLLSEAFALDGAIGVAQECGEMLTVERHVERLITLSQEQGFPYCLLWGTMVHGWQLTVQGNAVEGIAQLRQGIDALRKGGQELGLLYFMGLLAEAYGRANQAEEGLAVLNEALEIAGQRSERFYEAEVYRLKGELTLQQTRAQERGKGEPSKETAPRPLTSAPQGEAEACFLNAIAIAQHQQAKSLELRARVSLARLWQSQGKQSEAREQLEGVYGWFTEGFETQDLQAAAAVLRALGSTKESPTSHAPRSTPQVPAPRPLISEAQFSVLPPPAVSVPVARPHSLAANTFRPEGEYWTVSFAGTTCRLKDARGLHYLAYLLRHPHQEVHVMTLLTVDAEPSAEVGEVHFLQASSLSLDHLGGGSDAGEVLDPQARAAYRQRLGELREELAEAERFHDLGRREQVAAEMDFLTQELASAVGLGGRARRVGSPVERARVSITRAIKLALRKIAEHHPALGHHLATTIKTGAYCSYTPDARLPLTWQE